MLSGIHDSTLVAINVDLTKKRLSLTLDLDSTERTFAFNGMEAFSISNAALGSILADILKVPSQELLTQVWEEIAAGSKKSGWPGPWAVSLKTALDFADSHGLTG